MYKLVLFLYYVIFVALAILDSCGTMRSLKPFCVSQQMCVKLNLLPHTYGKLNKTVYGPFDLETHRVRIICIKQISLVWLALK